VRVTDMARVDLELFVFDYDLTFAALLMDADGTVHHRFGSRDARDPLHWNDLPGLARLMRETLDEHRARRAAGRASAEGGRPPRFVVDLPPLREKREADPQLAASCVHCHTVHDSMHADARQRAALPPDAEFVY